jgi:hypothetical protein
VRQRLARIALDRGGLVGVIACGLYVALASDHVLDGDNAEYSTLGTIGGVAHPTGYPLYLLWLRAMAWLPGRTPAHTASIATAIIAALCVIVLHAACRAWGARPLAATIAVAIYAGSPLVLRLGTQAEVFALNNLVAAAVLLLAADAGPARGLWRAGALGLVAGLGMSDHLTCVLLAPIGILGIVRAVREANAWAIAVAAAGVAVGLTPYAYLVATDENAMSWGQHIDGPRALLHHFLREDYGGPGAFAPAPEPIAASDNLFALARMLGRTWLWLPLAIGVVALVDRLRDREVRWSWAMLVLGFALAGPLLVWRFDVTHEGPGLYVIQRFFVLPALVLAIPIAVGIDRLVRRATRRSFDIVAAALLVVVALTSLSYVQQAHSPAVELGVRNMLRALPQDSVAIVYEDDLHFGAGYVQLIRGERRDVTVILSTAIGLPVYRERLERRLGMPIVVRNKLVGVEFATAVLASGRALFVDALTTDILAAFPHYPYGLLFRILPRGTPPPAIHDVFELNKSLYASFELGYALPSFDADWPVHVHIRYAQMWQVIGDELRASGQREDAAFALELGRELAPVP